MIGSMLLFAGLAHADPTDSESCLRTKIWQGYDEGWAVRTVANANVADAGHRVYMVTLYQGNTYKILACGDKFASNVDLVLYDKTGTAVQRDQSPDREPAISFSPTATDTFYIAVFNTTPREPGKAVDIATAVTFK